jgi:hypothetical protein
MLCYGVVFHLVLFNFYLSIGFCVWSLAVIWNRPVRRWFVTLPLWVLAYVAHPLPVGWFVAVAIYFAIARILDPRHRFSLTMACVVAILGLRLVIQLTMRSAWEPHHILLVTGASGILS